MQPKTSEQVKISVGSKTEILNELNLVLCSDLFSRSTVLSNFLKFIVEETLEGHTEGLKEYTIAVSALGRPSDFNPQIDAIVRIHAGRLRRLLKEYYTGPGKLDTIKIEVIKGTYVPVFRMNSNGTPTEAVPKEVEPVSFSRSKLTLAVLPFRNLCPNKEYQFFVDGFGEELTRIFSNFQEIAVISHHSTRKYASNPEDVRVIGAQLGVHYLITGSVKRTTETINVSVGLIETLNGKQVWSQSYSHELNVDNLTYIQDQIVENLCSILGGNFGFIIHENSKTHRKTITNLDAFDAALWHYYFHTNFSQETYLQTRHALEEALRQDPHYATGMAMLAELYLDAYSLGYPTVDNPVQTAYDLAKKATKIDPQCQHAFQEYGWACIHLKRKEEGLEALEYCLALNPSSVSTIGTIGFGMACAGEYKRADILLSKSIDLNPHCPWWFYLGFFLIYYKNKDYEKALEYANKIETSDVYLDPLVKAAANAQVGMMDEARMEFNIFAEKFPQFHSNSEAALHTLLLDTALVDEITTGLKKAEAFPR